LLIIKKISYENEKGFYEIGGVRCIGDVDIAGLY
jgi:hypothetical protein